MKARPAVFEKFIRMDERIHDYLLTHQPPEHPVLAALRAVTDGLPESKMQSTAEQGHFLALLVRLIDARRILEIGTFTGTSTLAMALALPGGGRITTCDLSDASTAIGRIHWDRAGVSHKIRLCIGPALDTLAEMEAASGQEQFTSPSSMPKRRDTMRTTKPACALYGPEGLSCLTIRFGAPAWPTQLIRSQTPRHFAR